VPCGTKVGGFVIFVYLWNECACRTANLYKFRSG